MTLKVADRVRENTSSTGVGGLSLTGSPAGFQRFNVFLASGDITYYTLEENDKWEVGVGTYGSNNLERTTILSSSNSGSKISLGGSGVVFVTYPAEKAIFNSETNQLVLGASGLLFSNGTNLKEAKLVELTDVNLSGTPAQNSVFDLNITNKSLSIGDKTGPTNSNNILIGYGAGSGITSGSDSVIIGSESSTINKTGQHNVHIGAKAGPTVSDAASAVYSSVAVGYSAGNKMRHQSIAIGYEAALHAYEIGFIGIGYQVGSGLGGYSTIIGYQAGRTLGEDYAIAIGYQAGYNGAGESAVWIGQGAGHSSTGSTKSIGIGKNAGKSSSGTECIYIGESAGLSNSASNLLFIGNGSPAASDTLIKGDMDSKRVAIGVADVTLSDTLFVGINAANDTGLVVKGAASQVSNLTNWTNSSDGIVASVDKNGIISGHGIYATGNGIQIANTTPSVTTNKLYNNAGTLYFNGSQIASAGASAEASYASGQAIANESDIVAVSGIAAYASGVSGGGGDVTTAQLNYVSGIAVYSSGQTIENQGNITALNTASGIATSLLAVSGTATSLVASSGIATYASGQAIENEGLATYASGQAISNQGNITALNTASGIATSLLAVSGTATSLVASSGIATYASGQAIENEGLATYASGQAISNQGDITALNTASGIATSLLAVSGTATSLVASSGIATYASGQAIENEGLATYASGQAISNQGSITALNTASGIATSLLAVSGTVTSLVATSGIASYASGNTANITFGSNAEGDILYHNGTSFSRLAKGTNNYILKMDGNVPNWEAESSGGGVSTADLNYVSGIAVYSSGQTISNQSNITALNTASGIATSLLAVSGTATSLVASSGIATYASGQAIENEGLATYASGQAISNQGNITALNTASGIATSLLTVSGTATSLVATSGIATYASGNTANISFGSNAEGDILYHNGSNFIRLAKGTDNYILKMNGNSPNWEAESGGSSLTAASGIVVDGADKINIYGGTGNLQEIQLTSDNIFTPKMVFTGSGVQDTPITLSVLSSYASVNTSGTALSYEGTQGQLFAITDNLSSGVIFSVSDITGLPLVTVDASGDVKLGEYGRYVGVGSGVPSYGLDVFSSGILRKGVIISDYTPATTANALYNEGGTLKFNGGATYASLLTASGIATSLLTVSGTATALIASSGIATYASGQAISNQSNITALNTASGIATSLITVSGTATSLVASSGIATYASGQAIENEGLATYASGQAISNQSNITALNTASGIATSLLTVSGVATSLIATSGTTTALIASSGIATYASGQVNVTTAGTAVASKALVLDSAKSFTGTKHGVFSQFDSRVTASGVTIGASGITLTGGAYVQEAVPANDTPTTEDATVTIDLNTGNYHNVVLGVNVTKFEFINSKRGQRFLLRITQHAGSAKTVAWTNVDYTTGGAAAAVRWAEGGTAPTMSTATSHTDVYGFLCTNNAGSAFDGFVVGQNLPD